MDFAAPHLKIIFELCIPFVWNEFNPSLLPHRISQVQVTFTVTDELYTYKCVTLPR